MLHRLWTKIAVLPLESGNIDVFDQGGGQKSRYCPWNQAISKFLTRGWTKIAALPLESGNIEDFDQGVDNNRGIAPESGNIEVFDQRVDKNHGIAPGIGQYRSF
ncbi:MAG: hypothetical protein QM296_09270 [Bacillota bacterium]|nr:hypothetical protein [Bacillota bacterium]